MKVNILPPVDAIADGTSLSSLAMTTNTMSVVRTSGVGRNIPTTYTITLRKSSPSTLAALKIGLKRNVNNLPVMKTCRNITLQSERTWTIQSSDWVGKPISATFSRSVRLNSAIEDFLKTSTKIQMLLALVMES